MICCSSFYKARTRKYENGRTKSGARKRQKQIETYIELALLLVFGGISSSALIDLPNLATFVLIAKTIVIDNKVVVASRHLTLVIFILVQLLENSFCFFDLNFQKQRIIVSDHYLKFAVIDTSSRV